MWQMLLKGITEVQAATRPAAAAEMVLVRIAYVADLPTPDEAIRMLNRTAGRHRSSRPTPRRPAGPGAKRLVGARLADTDDRPHRKPRLRHARRRCWHGMASLPLPFALRISRNLWRWPASSAIS